MRFILTVISAIYLWITLTIYAAAQSNDDPERLVCVPFGTCEPCPDDALHEPFCQPFGNRRLMHCRPPHTPPSSAPSVTDPTNPGPTTSSSNSHAKHTTSQLDSHHTKQAYPSDRNVGEIPAWESCGRIVEKERADFYEFFGFNLVLAGLAIFGVLARTRTLQAMQARHLAARIGLVRNRPPGWRDG